MTIPDVVSGCTGGIGSAATHKKFYLFEEVLNKFDLMVPATFEEYSKNGSDATFVARGCHTVNDYVVVSKVISVVKHSAAVYNDFESAKRSGDHLPTAVSVDLPTPEAYGIVRRRRATYDRRK
eukprot:7448487-Karenia_brevis.AAC.1